MDAVQIDDGWSVVNERGRILAGPFPFKMEAVRWIDRRKAESESMPRVPRDRDAVIRQIELILKTETWKAIQAAVPQIEAVLRQTEIPVQAGISAGSPSTTLNQS